MRGAVAGSNGDVMELEVRWVNKCDNREYDSRKALRLIAKMGKDGQRRVYMHGAMEKLDGVYGRVWIG